MAQKAVVPTATIIVANSANAEEIIVFESLDKHKGALTLPGGRCDFAKETPKECALRECLEEVKVKLDKEPLLFNIVTTIGRDIRVKGAEKLGGDSEPDPALNGYEFELHFGYGDQVFLGYTSDSPTADGVEGKNARFFNVLEEEINDEGWALDFAEYARTYRDYLLTGKTPLHNQVVRSSGSDVEI